VTIVKMAPKNDPMNLSTPDNPAHLPALYTGLATKVKTMA
jgi:hypothetical protein